MITDISYKEEDNEQTNIKKNEVLIRREGLYLFSYAYEELRQQGLIDEEMMENGFEENEDGEEEPKEIFEYWLVSDWLFEKLREVGEPVIEWAGLNIWGRTTTGQSIALDGCITQIRESMN